MKHFINNSVLIGFSGSDEWHTLANRIPCTSHMTEELRPGGVFQFRVQATFSESESSHFSSPSELIAVPLEGT